MAIQDDTTLKSYFQTNDTPTEAQFGDLIDSKVSKTATGTMKVDNIYSETVDGNVRIEDILINGNKIAMGSTQTDGMIVRAYDIGSWNMNVSVAGSLTKTVILDSGVKNPDAVMVAIYADGEVGQARSFERAGSTATGGNWKVDGNGDVELSVAASSAFDSTSYDGTSNRGRVVVIKFSSLT